MPTPGKVLVDGGTGTVLTIAAPTAPAFIRIFSAQLTVSATSTVELKSGSTTKDKAYLGTSIPYNRDATNPGAGGFLDCDPGEAFTITNSAGTIAGQVNYAVVGAVPVGGFNAPPS